MKTANKSLRGVTLVEIAIVLVIIGLLLGGILKGQELINNARIRAIADGQAGLKASWYAFIDRYRGLPGDYIQAQQHIPGAGAARTGSTTGENSGDGFTTILESPIVFQHLTAAGFLRCPTCVATGLEAPTLLNSPANAYGGVQAIFHDEDYYATDLGTRQPRLSAQSGPNIPSNIVRDVDLKVDDGQPVTGDFRSSTFAGAGFGGGTPEECITGVAVGTTTTPLTHAGSTSTAALTTLGRNSIWRHADVEIFNNCSASVTF
ncbi:MAG: prepilin-type N-terminal cleavage/methylation domain-containing protein [Gammaproteobacteria bacterium WSBS_2016_MAG_OTU1]